MKILIVSDTHSRCDGFEKIIEKKGPFDRVFHLGDIEGNEGYFIETAGCPVEIVQGNNDFFSTLPKELELEIGKYRILLTHGHLYYVTVGMQELRNVAIERQFDIVCFGHTHRPLIMREKNYTIVNPGSLNYPRQEGKLGSYCIMELDDENGPSFAIHYL